MSQAQKITLALSGHWHGSYGVALCPAHQNTKTPALSIANGTDGRLLIHCFAGCSYRSVMAALRQLGVTAANVRLTVEQAHSGAEAFKARTDDVRKRNARALAIWQGASPIQGTLAERYLRARGITGALPASLRFDPRTWHSPTKVALPALIARVDGLDHVSIHRTYLHPEGPGKAKITPAKMMLGQTIGGAVRLSNGAGPLVVTEGIETALSLASGLIPYPASVWAALSAAGMAALKLPQSPHRLTIATDGDATGRTAGFQLAQRAVALGWNVQFLPAPEKLDWNDVLLMKGDLA